MAINKCDEFYDGSEERLGKWKAAEIQIKAKPLKMCIINDSKVIIFEEQM